MGRRRKRILPALFIVVLLAAGTASLSASAQMGGAFPQFEWGGRFQASFLYGAPADDGFAALFNPAAVRGCVSGQVSVQQLRPFGVPFTALGWCGGAAPVDGTSERVATGRQATSAAAAAAGAPPAAWRWGGHAVLRQTPDGLGFDYNTYQLGLTAAATLRVGSGTLTLGATPKLLVVVLDGTGTAMDETALGFGLDAGLGYTLPLAAAPRAGGEGIRADWVAVDVAVLDAASRVRYKSGAVERGATPVQRVAVTAGGQRWTAGVSARRHDEEVVWGLGLEWIVLTATDAGSAAALQQVALRAGWGGPERGIALGIGVGLRGIVFDYAYRMDGGHGTHVVSTSWRF